MSIRTRGITRSPSPTSNPSPKRQRIAESSSLATDSGLEPTAASSEQAKEVVSKDGSDAVNGAHLDKSSENATSAQSDQTAETKEVSLPTNPAATHVPAGSTEDDDEEVEELPEPEEEEEDGARGDMYLDTIARQHLDFDFERLCSKSMSNINVYCCLVCGKYFQGRGRGSWAYRHSMSENHRVWLNLETEKFYVLPEGYQVSDPSLQDIISVLNPRYNTPQVSQLSLLPSKPAYTLNAQPYSPGYIGLNNIGANDYMNVIIHLLLHIPPIRDFFLSPNTPQLQLEARPTELVKRFATLAKRLWNPRLFKAQVSPHEFLQEVNKRSKGKFVITEQGDPVAFLGWLLNTLHVDLGGTKKANSSIIYKTFQGEVRIQTQEFIVDKRASRPVFDIGRDIKTIKSPFLFLALDLPAAPIFQDLNENRIIPQVPLGEILAKYDGKTTQETGNTLKRHHLTRLPPYLVLFIKRFTSNNFVKERNPTIVNFPLRGVDLKDHIDTKSSSPMATMYDLIANIPHETTSASTGNSTTGANNANANSNNPLPSNVSSKKKGDRNERDTNWKIHLRAGAGGADAEKWFALHDLDVDEVRREMVFLGETVIQVWERRDVQVQV